MKKYLQNQFRSTKKKNICTRNHTHRKINIHKIKINLFCLFPAISLKIYWNITNSYIIARPEIRYVGNAGGVFRKAKLINFFITKIHPWPLEESGVGKITFSDIITTNIKFHKQKFS